MVMKADFWQEKKVFITGHTGFKGSWLSLWLQSVGANVIGYALKPPTSPSLFEVAQVAEGMTSIIGDVRDIEYLQTVIAQHQPEIIFHMAAQPLVRYSYSNPVETYATNVMGTVHLLEAVRQVESAKVVINITSDKCYENQEWVWGYRENEPMGGYDPYSNSKGCAELVTSAYRQSFFS
jgi:CDP-glucose 4,6-dehydratase